jgi:hypothetical protein
MLKHVLKRIFEILEKYLGIKQCVLVLSESYFENDHLKKIMGFTEEELEKIPFSVWLNPLGNILSQKNPCILNPYTQKLHSLKENISDKEFLAFPIRLGDENIGVFYCSIKKGKKSSDQRLNLLSVICLMIGQ